MSPATPSLCEKTTPKPFWKHCLFWDLFKSCWGSWILSLIWMGTLYLKIGPSSERIKCDCLQLLFKIDPRGCPNKNTLWLTTTIYNPAEHLCLDKNSSLMYMEPIRVLCRVHAVLLTKGLAEPDDGPAADPGSSGPSLLCMPRTY